MKVFGVDLDKKDPGDRRTLENPNTTLDDPAEWLVDVFGGGQADSGILVNSKTALTYSPVYRATALLARSVAKLPLLVYKRTGDGKERATDHPAYNLLRQRPNSDMGAFKWKETCQARVLNKGNSYSYVIRDGSGKPIEIIPLVPDKTYPVRENGILMYVTEVSGQIRKLPASNVLHIRGLGDDGILGQSVISYAKESLGLGMAAQKFGAVFFKNGAKPSIVLEHPANLSKPAAERLRDSWMTAHSGLDNAHKPAVLEEGMKVNAYSQSNEDSQLLGLLAANVRDVANWYGLPPHLLGDTTRTAYASLEMENQSFLDNSLDPWLCLWEEECREKLLTEEEKRSDSHVIEFMRSALARANMSERYNAYTSALQNGWMSRDEVRARENLNPIPDGEGEKFFIPKNMDLSGEDPKKPPAAPPPQPFAPVPPDDQGGGQEDDEADRYARVVTAHRALMIDLAGRLGRRLLDGARKAARDPNGFMPWLDERMEPEFSDGITDTARPVIVAWRAVSPEQVTTTEDFTGAFFRVAREALLEAADSKPVDLARAVDHVGERFKGPLRDRIVDEFMRCTHGA
jgi:HK97 family phage portal protein